MNPGFRNLWPSIRAEIERHMPAATGWLVIEFIQGELAAEEAPQTARRRQGEEHNTGLGRTHTLRESD